MVKEEKEDGKKERKKRMTEKKDQQGVERRERILDCQALHLRRVYTPWAPWPAVAATHRESNTDSTDER